MRFLTILPFSLYNKRKDHKRMIRMQIQNDYNHTIYASYLGYITQAIVNNFAPLLFLTFSRDYSLSLEKIALITTLNFLVQLSVDLASAGVIDKIGYRIPVLTAHVFSAGGLVALAVLPKILPDPYIAILIAVVLYAIGGGLIEVLISPIVEACPTEKKEAAMSLLHSFYCWGHLGVILLSTLFFTLFGIRNWPVLSCLWALVPAVNVVYFSLVPLFPITGEHEPLSLRSLLKEKTFWILMVLMICAGASEHSMSQWASAFAESGLNLSKTVGDLAGPSLFALLMGTARALYGKYSERIKLDLAIRASALLCLVSFAMAAFLRSSLFGLLGCACCGFAVGIFWPGTFSLAAIKLPAAGASMYALLALGGDIGCSLGPTSVGFVAGHFNGDLHAGFVLAMLFPALILILTGMLGRHSEAGRTGQ